MRIRHVSIVAGILGTLSLVSPIRAQVATMNEALTVANNWVDLIIDKKGNWGHSKTAEVVWIQEFTRENRSLGYFCSVKPTGFVVISLRKELAPIKAYSTDSNMNPESDVGMADIIKGGIERIHERIEEQIGPIESISSDELLSFLELEYMGAWDELENPNDGVSIDQLKMDYQEGDVLLSSNWHQGNPFNQDCPTPPAGDDCTGPRCVVGCVATAASQIMHYWHWPPIGYGSPYEDTYDWPNMPDTLLTTSPQIEIDAVAELCHEVGMACDMIYCGGSGCASGAFHSDMRDAFADNFQYSTSVNVRERNDFTAVEWFERIKSDLSANRPLQYGVPGHSIVTDGWQEIGATPIRQYHMNYGWAGWVPSPGDGAYNPDWDSYTNSNWWYTLDCLPGSNEDSEDIIEDIYPATSLGPSISGTYNCTLFPFRYFDRDATGSSAIFSSGQFLQFLEHVVVTCTSTTGGSIEFHGSETDSTRLFTKGDPSVGICITGGTLKLSQSGSIRFDCPHLN